MSDMNGVHLTGRLTKDIELKYTQSGKSVVNFNLACNRKKNQNGEQKADFIQCQAWEGIAETLAKYCSKGSRLGIEGSIRTRNYQNQQGQTVYVTEVIVSNLNFLDAKNSQNNGDFSQVNQNHINSQTNNSNAQDYVNFSQKDNVMSEGYPIELSEDDLPF